MKFRFRRVVVSSSSSPTSCRRRVARAERGGGSKIRIVSHACADPIPPIDIAANACTRSAGIADRGNRRGSVTRYARRVGGCSDRQRWQTASYVGETARTRIRMANSSASRLLLDRRASFCVASRCSVAKSSAGCRRILSSLGDNVIRVQLEPKVLRVSWTRVLASQETRIAFPPAAVFPAGGVFVLRGGVCRRNAATGAAFSSP